MKIHRNTLVRQLLLVAVILLIPVSLVLAQADGSMPPAGDPAPTDAKDPVVATPPAETADTARPQTGVGGGTSGSASPAPTGVPAATSSSTVPVAGAGVSQVSAGAADTPTPQTSAASEEVTPQESGSPDANVITLAAAVAVALLGLIGVAIAVKGSQKQNKNTDSSKCNSIQALLEQKKKELEDMVRNYPEEKIKALAKNAVLTEIKKDEAGKAVIEAVDEAQAAYNKLKRAIDLLEVRFDLCMLSLPSVGSASYTGTIVENSLKDPKILENLKIKKHYEAGDWKLKDVSVNGAQIKKLGASLNDGPWYMHFWQANKNDGIVVFKDKQFVIKYKDKQTWKDAVVHGKALGIPEEQLDFVVKDA